MPSAPVTAFFAAVALAAVAGAAAVTLRPPLLYGPPPAPPAPRPAPPRDPLRSLPPELTEMLVHPGFDAPSPFLRVTRIKPEPFCKGLTATGLRGAAFTASPPPMVGWTCVTDLVKPMDGPEDKVSSLFVAVRGIEADRIDNIRVKLNLIDEATVPLVKIVAKDLVSQICRDLGWEPPAAVMAALETMKEGRIIDNGVSFDLRREFGPAERYNLIVIFPRTLGSGGENRFVTDIRRTPVAR